MIVNHCQTNFRTRPKLSFKIVDLKCFFFFALHGLKEQRIFVILTARHAVASQYNVRRANIKILSVAILMYRVY